jgi:methanogenic corrinoid protein MtbC1
VTAPATATTAAPANAAYWEAIAGNDAARAMAVVDAELAAGREVADLLDDLVVATQHRVGRLWAEGTWSVPQEHAATAVSEYVVRTLLARGELAGDERTPALLVACAEREWHALPGLVLAALLAHGGHRVVLLGSDVSTRALHGALLDHRVRAVLVSASITSSLPFVRRLVETATQTGVPVVVGGQAFDAEGRRAAAVGATSYAADAATLAALIDELPSRVDRVAPLSGALAEEARLLGPRVGATARSSVHAVLADEPLDEDVEQLLSDQAPVVVGTVVSALVVDDAAVVGDALAWLGEVLAARADRDVADRVVARLVEALRRELRDFPHALATLPA